MNSEIENLIPYSIPDTAIEIEFEVLKTLIDGKTRVSLYSYFICSNFEIL